MKGGEGQKMSYNSENSHINSEGFGEMFEGDFCRHVHQNLSLILMQKVRLLLRLCREFYIPNKTEVTVTAYY